MFFCRDVGEMLHVCAAAQYIKRKCRERNTFDVRHCILIPRLSVFPSMLLRKRDALTERQIVDVANKKRQNQGGDRGGVGSR